MKSFEFDFGYTEAFVLMILFLALISVYHFAFFLPKQKKQNNKPVIDATKHSWDKWVDEQFNCN